MPGFCRSATLEEMRKHSHVLTPGRYVGAAAAEDDGEPFEEKMKRLTATLHEQQSAAAKLDAAISANLKELGYGGEPGATALASLCSRITKGTTPTTLGYAFVDRGVNFVKSESVTDDGRIDESKFAFITESTHAALSRSILEEGDVLFSMAGVYLGKTAVVPRSILPANTNQAVESFVWIRARQSLASSTTLCSSPECRSFVLRSVAQSAQPNFNLRDIGSLPIPALPLAHQQAIAHILGTLDEKIELNRRMNETLEAIARALYKSWFVDFDPVRAKAEGRDPGLPEDLAALFPTRLVDSELGEIPEGWRSGYVDDLCSTIFSGGTPNTQVAAFWHGDIPWLSSGETRDAFVIDTERRITKEGVLKSSTRLASALSTVIASAGQGNTRGQTSLIGFDSYINQSVVALRADTAISSHFHLYFDLERRYEEFRRISDAHSSRGSLTTKLIAGSGAVVPSRPVIECFDRLVEPLVAQLFTLKHESRTLAALRDTLLPRLISGELRVGDAQRLVAGVAA